MSQLSIQSSSSSTESRKRRCSDGSIRSLRPKVPHKARFIDYQGQLHKMPKKSSKLEDETSSPSSVKTAYSQAASVSSETEKSLSPDHRIIARKYGVSITTVRNYYSTLSRVPQVPLIKIDGIKQVYSSQPRSRSTSPILGSFRKRARSKAKQLSPVPNCSIVNKDTHDNIQNYLSSLSSLKQECSSVVECEESFYAQSKCSQAPLTSWASWPNGYSSGEEFELSKYTISSKSEKIGEINGNLVKNHLHQNPSKTPKNSPALNSNCHDGTSKSSPVFNSRSKSKTPKSSPIFGSRRKSTTPKNSPVFGSRSRSKTPKKPSSAKSAKVTHGDIESSPCSGRGINQAEENGKELRSCRLKNPENSEENSVDFSRVLPNPLYNGDSFWGALSADRTLKKQKFIETFEIKKEESEESEEEHEILHVKNPVSSIPQEKLTNRLKKKCDKSCCKSGSGGTKNSDILSNADSLNDSILVNFPTIFTPQEKTESETRFVGNDNCHGPILSFGDDLYPSHSNQGEDELMDVLNPLVCNQLDNNAQKNADEDDVIMAADKMIPNDDGSAIEKPILDDDFLDLMGPLDFDFLPSPKKDEAQKQSPHANVSKNVRKAKPIIISDSILKDNPIQLALLKSKTSNSHKKIPESSLPLHSIGSLNRCSTELEIDFSLNKEISRHNGFNPSLPNGIVTTSHSSNFLAASHNDLSTNSPISKDPPRIPKENGCTNIDQVTNNHITLEESNADCKTTSRREDNSEETFESLCLDVCKLTKIESITLYKGDGTESAETPSEKITLRMGIEESSTSVSSAPNVVMNGHLEHNEDESGRISPILSRKSLRLRKRSTPSPQKALNNLEQREKQIDSFEKLKSVSETILDSSPRASSQAVSRDPRLNKSLSPTKQISSSSRDPRLNRSSSPVKASTFDKDSDLKEKKSASFSVSSCTPDAPGEENSEALSKIVDPRLRKRKEREDAEKRAKLNASNAKVDENDSNVSKSSPDAQQGTSKRSSVFDRLGAKKVKLTPSPERSHPLDFEPPTEFVPNELLHIIKTRRKSPSKSGNQDSGDELSVDLDDVFSSGEEELTASPPHRKFTSERVDYVEPEPVPKSSMPGGYRKHGRWNEQTRNSMGQSSDVRSRLSLNQNVLNQNRLHCGQPIFPRPPLLQQHPIQALRTLAQPSILNSQHHLPQALPNLTQPPPIFNQQIPPPMQPFSVPTPNIHQRLPTMDQQTPAQPSSIHQRLTLPSQRVPKQVSSIHQRLSLPSQKVPAQPAVQKVAEPPPAVPTRIARNFNPHASPPKSGPDLSYSYYEMNNEQLRKDFENLEAQETEASDQYITFDGDSDTPNRFDHVSILGDTSKPPRLGSTDGNKTCFFKRACYKLLKTGKCMDGNNCMFSHELTFLHKQLKQKRPELLYPILDFAIAYRFEHFLTVTWATVLQILQDGSFSIFEKLYEINIRGDQLIREFLNFCIASKLHTPESFIKKVSPIVALNDRSTVRSIWIAIKDKLPDGFCWESVKDLCQKAVPPLDMVEITILQCLHRKKNQTHIKEVYDLVENRLSQEEKNKMSPDMLKKFIDLVKEKGIPITEEKPTVNGTSNCASSTKSPLALKNKSIDSVQQSETQISLSTRPPSPILTRTRKLSPIRAPKPTARLPQLPGDPPSLSQSRISDPKQTNRLQQPLVSLQTNSGQQQRNGNLSKQLQPRSPATAKPDQQKAKPGVANSVPNGRESQDSSYQPKTIDDLQEPKKGCSRKRFWKLFAALDAVQRGLENEDYDFVWKTINDFTSQEIAKELLLRAYYQVLCRDIKSSQEHIDEVIHRAGNKDPLAQYLKRYIRNVRCDSSRQSKEILFEVGVWALIDLANADLWMMALQLLNQIKILAPDEPDCTFILISTEIYLANNDPLEALDLLKRTRLLRTNRDEWRIKESTVYDEKHRNKLVLILMKALSYVDQEKALWVFKELLKDQYMCYFPIDLPLYMDELALLLLLFANYELAADLSRIAMANDLTFKRTTYQELISRMLPYDEVLANQLLDYAMHLGYYHDIQIKNGHTCVIIDMNYVEEEIYLILKRLIRKLTLSVGPGVDRLKPTSLKVILILEDIPDEKRLYRNDVAMLDPNKYKNIRNAINSMLSTRFSPPIRITSGKASKYCKLVSRTLVDYLKHWR